MYAPSVFQKQLCPCISSSSDTAMAGQWSGPLKILDSDWIFFILVGNKKNYIASIEFKIGPDPTMDCGPIEKIFYLLENYLKILANSQLSNCCPLGYLL